MMLRAEPDGDMFRVVAVLIVNLCGLGIAQFNNYYNWPDTDHPKVKTEVHEAGRETRIRCQVKDRFRHIQNGLNLTWEFKAGSAAACMEAGAWRPLCGGAGPRCPPVLTLMDPQSPDSGLYRCQITLDTSQPAVVLNLYLLHFTVNRRKPPEIVEGMDTNVTVVAPLLASLQCKVSSPVPPIIRWFRRLETNSSSGPPNNRHNFIQYLNNTYKLMNCCPVAALSRRDLYLSKLVIASSTVYDSGFYICLAINDANYTLKEAYINVLPLMKIKDEKNQTKSLFVLFIIPAVFALIPTLVWLMCLRPRKLTTLDPLKPACKLASLDPLKPAPGSERPLIKAHSAVSSRS